MANNHENQSRVGIGHEAHIASSMYYLDRAHLQHVEKPYSMRYLPEEDIPQTNYMKVKHPILVKSMREPGAGPFHIDECGFQIIDLHSSLTYDEFWDNERVQQVYVEEVKEALKRELGAKYVHVLDYAVRRRHESFPVSTGEEYQYDQPTALAHIDFTVDEGERITKVLFGDRAGEVLRGRWQAINVWKPIKGPLNDWPLGLCDSRTVNFENDTIAGDIVFDEFVTENLQIFPSPNFQWYYLPDQNIWEALVFKSADSDGTTVPGCPHSGFYNPHIEKGDLRESLDCRTFVFYEDLEEYPPIVGDVFQAKAHIL
ncbi:Fe(II)/2-oxoglutarate-dependent dioxygenase nvfI-like protein [Cladobotryum mycophilum]|uniref:Fe(II)/2-oxoglutarate-dependent dioxygenase nvfI-like protein n=1 Tax=Cladobotryum mycophilum TaxID=491253 RepID=A0ABR0ST06_9HYPO